MVFKYSSLSVTFLLFQLLFNVNCSVFDCNCLLLQNVCSLLLSEMQWLLRVIFICDLVLNVLDICVPFLFLHHFAFYLIYDLMLQCSAFHSLQMHLVVGYHALPSLLLSIICTSRSPHRITLKISVTDTDNHSRSILMRWYFVMPCIRHSIVFDVIY